MSRTLIAVASASLFLAGRAGAQEAQPEDAPFSLVAIDPWFRRNADELPARLQPGRTLALDGMRNDWLVAAAALAAKTSSDVTVRLEGPPR